MRLLFLGDVVGEPGRKTVMHHLAEIKKDHQVDFVVVNGENAAAGRGITPKIAQEFLASGVDVVTLGDHAWDQRDLAGWISTAPRVLRPLNYPEGTPGQGSVVVETAFGLVGVIQLQGRTFIQPPLENPFIMGEQEVEKLRSQGVKMIFVDFHAETTSEKIAMGYFLNGKISALVGTHTHVQTADEVVYPEGTAFLTDAGMCGPIKSVLGREIQPIIDRFVKSMPTRFPVAGGDVVLNGALIDIDEESGKSTHIERYRKVIEKTKPSSIELKLNEKK